MSAAHCVVRMKAGLGRPSAVHTSLLAELLDFLRDRVLFWLSSAVCAASPRAAAAGLRCHASSERVCKESTSTLGAQHGNLSRLRTHVAPIVIEASCVRTGTFPGRALSADTRITVEPHLMSNLSFRRRSLRLMTQKKKLVLCSTVSCLESGPRSLFVEFQRLLIQFLLNMRLRSRGVALSLNHKKTILLIALSQLPIKLYHVGF